MKTFLFWFCMSFTVVFSALVVAHSQNVPVNGTFAPVAGYPVVYVNLRSSSTHSWPLANEQSRKKAAMRCALYDEWEPSLGGNTWTCESDYCTSNLPGSGRRWDVTSCVDLSSAERISGAPWTRRCRMKPNYTSVGSGLNGWWLYYSPSEISAGYALPESSNRKKLRRACNYTIPSAGALLTLQGTGPNG